MLKSIKTYILFIVILLSGFNTYSHHQLYFPHYLYSEDFPQIPTMVIDAKAEGYNIAFSIFPENQLCYMRNDFPCIRECPTKALQFSAFYKIGTAYINKLKCLAYNGQICDYCYEYCPEKNIAIFFKNKKPYIIEEKCKGCGICQYYCPASQFSIFILPNIINVNNKT